MQTCNFRVLLEIAILLSDIRTYAYTIYRYYIISYRIIVFNRPAESYTRPFYFDQISTTTRRNNEYIRSNRIKTNAIKRNSDRIIDRRSCVEYIEITIVVKKKKKGNCSSKLRNGTEKSTREEKLREKNKGIAMSRLDGSGFIGKRITMKFITLIYLQHRKTLYFDRSFL